MKANKTRLKNQGRKANKQKVSFSLSTVYCLLSTALPFVICCFLIFPVFPFAALPPNFGGDVTVGIQTKISNFMPSLVMEDDEFMLLSCIYEPLVKLNTDGEIVPILLEKSPVESDDQFTYYFKLKDNVFFHNGKKLTSNDVLFTIREVLKSHRSPYSWIFQDIDGALEFRKGTSDKITGVRVVDGLRFEIELKKPNPNFIRYLTLPAAFIMATGVDNSETPVGTGPFMFKGKREAGNFILEANPKYHGGRPYLDRLVFRVIPDSEDAMIEYKRGKLDVAEAPPNKVKDIKATGEGYLLEGFAKRLVFLDINNIKKPLDDIYVRKQLLFAVDRAAIVEVILSGQGAVENYLAGNKKVLPKRVTTADVYDLWYPENDRTLAFVAERIKYDLFVQMNLQIRLVKRSPGEMLALEKDKEPSFMLRSLPVLASLPETIEATLFNAKFPSRFNALMLRMRQSSDAAIGLSSVPVIYLYSYKDMTLVSSKLSKPRVNYLNGLTFDEMFRR